LDSTHHASGPQSASLSAALDRLWERYLPEIELRLAAIESAANAIAAGTLTSELQQAAHAAAHNLAGTLGSFGLAGGTAPARETEHSYAAQATPGREDAARLAELAATLRGIIESRKRPQTTAK
jgi:HPt (histidine-containing phosphotransfer) domain-containing protein